MSIRFLLLVPTCGLLCACAGMFVSKDESSGGVPFYVKQAVLVQQTKLRTITFKIQFDLVDRATDKVIAIVPAAGPLALPKNAHNTRLVSKLVVPWNQATGPTPDAIETALTNLLKSLVANADLHEDDAEVVSNSWKFDAVLGPERYYIRTRSPLVGTATSEFTLADDGTLTKASSTVTDQTLSTFVSPTSLPSLLGFAPGSTAEMANMDLMAGAPVPPVAHQTPADPIRIRLVVTEEPTVYTLQKVHPAPEGGWGTAPPCKGGAGRCIPLTLADARSRTDNQGVELVSVSSGVADKHDDSDKAYQISGSIVPPKADKK